MFLNVIREVEIEERKWRKLLPFLKWLMGENWWIFKSKFKLFFIFRILFWNPQIEPDGNVPGRIHSKKKRELRSAYFRAQYVIVIPPRKHWAITPIPENSNAIRLYTWCPSRASTPAKLAVSRHKSVGRIRMSYRPTLDRIMAVQSIGNRCCHN